MLYDSLYSDFCELFKEDTQQFEKMQKEQLIENTDGMHILFGFIVMPYVANLVAEDQKEKLKIAFTFFEKMAESQDTKISEVLEFTVLEGIIAKGKDYRNLCKPFMGEKTLESCACVGEWFDNKDKTIKELDSVKLLVDYKGISAGTIGVIVHEYDGTAFEVEYFDDSGNTIDVLTTPASLITLEKEL